MVFAWKYSIKVSLKSHNYTHRIIRTDSQQTWPVNSINWYLLMAFKAVIKAWPQMVSFYKVYWWKILPNISFNQVNQTYALSQRSSHPSIKNIFQILDHDRKKSWREFRRNPFALTALGRFPQFSSLLILIPFSDASISRRAWMY